MKISHYFRQCAALILTAALLLSLAGCSSPSETDPSREETTPSQPASQPSLPDPEPTALDLLRQTMAREEAGCAVAFLGLFTGEYDSLTRYLGRQGFLTEYPYLADIPQERYIQAGGEELYLIVPAKQDSLVLVYEWLIDESNDFAGGKGQTLYASETGEPFLVQCNVSDIMPNALVRIGALEYMPYISLRDGGVAVPDDPLPGQGVLDISLPHAGAAPALPENGSLEGIRDYLRYADTCLAVAYLGLWEGEYSQLAGYFREQGLDLRWPFLMDIPEECFARSQGRELYLIVPRDPLSRVQVAQIGSASPEDILYQSEQGGPFLVLGNSADAPNIQITLEEPSGRQAYYYPTVIPETGELYWDYQMTDLNPIPIEQKTSVSPDAAQGCWQGYTSTDSELWNCFLELQNDGSVSYGCSSDNEDGPDRFYTGTWSRQTRSQKGLPATVYVLELTLASGDALAPQNIHTTQYIFSREGSLCLNWMDGDPLLPDAYAAEIWLDFLGTESMG